MPAVLSRQRLQGKQRAPAHYVLPRPAYQALVDEAWSELTSLSEDKRRKHVHWVHVRTADPQQKQPEAFTREGFWSHLSKVYKDVYPEPANPSGSILLFGMVAKERHAAAGGAGEGDEHHHCPCYTSLQHYWAPVARRSLELGVKLHAACHDGYTAMYVYIVCPSPKKPLHDLDSDVWFSPEHPRGRLLQKLLEVGNRACLGLNRKQKRCSGAAQEEEGQKRLRPADLYSFVGQTGVRTLLELQQRANAEAAAGDARLAEFCTTHKPDEVQQYLDNAWAVREAPQRALSCDPDLVAKLRKAALESACVCNGFWVSGVTYVLQNNHEDVTEFCSDVLRALVMGACRGVNLAIVGPPGCGKSTVFDALDTVFRVSGKPQSGSTFPFLDIVDAEVLLWQEFVWDANMCSFEDILSLMCGERIGIRQPGKKPLPHKNRAPMFYTAWEALTFRGRNPNQMTAYNEAVGERFKTRTWTVKLPKEGRLPRFPHCARCFSQWLLNNGRQ